MKIIDDITLNDLLLSVLSSRLLLHPQSAAYFQDMYVTGCRSTELLTTGKLALTDTHLFITTHKTGENRIIEKRLLSDCLIESLSSGQPPYYGISYHQLTKEFRTVIKLHPIWQGDRIADTYLFRYNRARLEFAATKNLLHVMDYFGWKSPTIASNYITAPLIFDPFKQSGP